jgi:hypothetical protein
LFFCSLDLEDSINEFVKLVPNEFHRKFYLRIYKWTIAFGTWNQPNAYLEKIQQSLREAFTLPQDYYSSPMKLPTVMKKEKYFCFSLCFVTIFSLRLQKTGSFLLPQYNESLSPTRSKSPTKNKKDKRFSFSKSLRTYSPPSDQKKNRGNNSYSPQKSASGPFSPFSPTKESKSIFSMSSPTNGSMMMMGSPMEGTTVIPFSMRQAKSTVAAREILKKSESVRLN